MGVETEELSILINLNLKTKEVLIFYVGDMLKLWYVGYAGLINRLLKLISTVFFLITYVSHNIFLLDSTTLEWYIWFSYVGFTVDWYL